MVARLATLRARDKWSSSLDVSEHLSEFRSGSPVNERDVIRDISENKAGGIKKQSYKCEEDV